MKKRILASLLALVMVLSMVPTALAAEKQLWFYELYYQSYASDGTLQDENGVPYNWVRQSHGQGSWAYPDDEV